LRKPDIPQSSSDVKEVSVAGVTRSSILLVAICALSAVVVAAAVSYGTVAVSAREAKVARAQFDAIKAEAGPIANPPTMAGLPIGTIVPSMLGPESFAIEVGDPRVFDPAKSKWVLADSKKDIKGSAYGRLLDAPRTPDLRGVFLRGLDDGRGLDPGRALGTFQEYEIQAHRHAVSTAGIWGRSFKGEDGTPKTAYEKTGQTAETGGKETRPKNVAVYFYIKIN
jgi:hypothetical protein